MFDVNNLQVKSNINAIQLEEAINKIKQDNKLKGLGTAFIDAENKYNVNAIILASIACLESGYGTSKLAIEKNNLFGLDAPLSASGTKNYGSGYESKEDCIDYAGHRIGKQYLELDAKANWRYCEGKKDIYTVGSKWCETGDWANKVISIANRIKNNINGGNCMNFTVHAGHNPDGKKACGAIGLIKESTENRNVKNEVIRLLKKEGHTVYDCTVENGTSVSDIVNKQVAKMNSYSNIDLHISIHFNSGANDKAGNNKTTGTEVLVCNTSGTKYDIAKRICSKVEALGYKNRGVKVRTDLGVLKKSKGQTLLVECCFVDDKDDIDLYNYKSMAKAIVEGVLNKTISASVPAPTPIPSEKVFYRAISGSFNDKNNALDRKSKLEKDGFDGVFLDAFVKDETTWYRVITGSFKDKKLAEQRVKELTKKGYDGAFISAFTK